MLVTQEHDLVPASPSTGVDSITCKGWAIVGADRLPDGGYMRAKVAQEGEIEARGNPLHHPARHAVP